MDKHESQHLNGDLEMASQNFRNKITQKESFVMEDENDSDVHKRGSSIDALDLHAGNRSLHEIRGHSDNVLARYADRFGNMGALDVLRESVTLLRVNSSIFMSFMVILICPISVILLSRPLIHGELTRKLNLALYGAADSVGLLQYLSLVKSIYENLSQALLSYILAAPIFFTVWLLAKASVIYIVSCSYMDKEPSLWQSINAGVRLWKRIFITYFWNCTILLVFIVVASALFLFMVSLLHALQFSADLIFLTELALGIFYSVIFAQMIIVGSLASVVCILEDCYGLMSLRRSFDLMKGKIQVALSLFFISTLGTTMVETLYRYRVLGIPPTNYAITTESRMWEGPLLIFMYSFLLLLDSVMGCVFYFTCKSSVPQHIFIRLESADV